MKYYLPMPRKFCWFMFGTPSCKEFLQGPPFLGFWRFPLRWNIRGEFQFLWSKFPLSFVDAFVQTHRLPQGLKLALCCSLKVAHLVRQGYPGPTKLLAFGQVGGASVLDIYTHRFKYTRTSKCMTISSGFSKMW